MLLQDRSSDEISESKRRKESPDEPALAKETEAAKVRLTLCTPTSRACISSLNPHVKVRLFLSFGFESVLCICSVRMRI